MGLSVQTAIIALGIVLMGVGVLGIDYHLGPLAAVLAILAAVLLRFMLPLTIGSYFAAVDVFGWPGWAGVVVAFPQLVFLAPSVVQTLVAIVQGRR